MAPRSKPDFSDLPPVFLLPTRYTEAELEELQKGFKKHHGTLVDIPEVARIVVCKINMPKRVLYELRGRGLHLQNVESVEDSGIEEEELIHIVRAEWLKLSLDERRMLPLTPFTIIRGRPVVGATSESSQPKKLKRTGSGLEREDSTKKRLLVLERAKQDAKKAAKRNTHGPPWKRHRTGELEDIKAAHKPVLFRKTTEEWDEEQKHKDRDEPEYVRKGCKFSCLRPTPLFCPNQEFVDCLKTIKLSRILQLDEIGVRAYSTAVSAIQAYPYELHTADEVQKLPGCDGKASALFSEWIHSSDDVSNRTLAVLQDLEASEEFNCLKAFFDIWGVGAKTAREFYFDRGWRSLDDVIEFGWDDLTRVQQIGVKFYDEINYMKIPRDEVERIAKIVNDVANELRPGYDYIICGGHRRGKEESGDVDMIISHPDPKMTEPGFTGMLVERLEALGWVTHTLYLGKGGGFGSQRLNKDGTKVRGERIGHGLDDGLEKAMVVWQEQEVFPEDYEEGDKNPNPHRRVDIILAPAIAAGTAILGWTGGTTFERDMRRYVEHTKSWKFDSGGVWDRITGKRLDIGAWKEGESLVECEKRTIEDMGLPYFPPPLRNTG